MPHAAWDSLLNASILLFWFGAWNKTDRGALFNPYLGPLHSAVDTVISWLGPLRRWMSGRGASALLCLALVLAYAALVAAGGTWPVEMGTFHGKMRGGQVLTAILYCPLSFALFLFRIWSLSLVYIHARRGGPAWSNPADTLFAVARPFTDIHPTARPPALLGIGMALALVLQYLAGMAPTAASATTAVALALARAFIITLSAWASVLLLLRTIIVVLIIASWVSMFAGSQALSSASRDWLDYLMGPLRNVPLRIGMLDLTPIVMIFALDAVYKLLMAVLLSSYNRLL